MLALVFGQTTGCIGLFILIVDILCIIQIAESSKSTIRKTLWIVLVVCFPALGALIWLLLGRK
jgi:Phospholipase_D-nuclease N-terminal